MGGSPDKICLHTKDKGCDQGKTGKVTKDSGSNIFRPLHKDFNGGLGRTQYYKESIDVGHLLPASAFVTGISEL